MGRHHDQVDAEPRCRLQNLFSRISTDNMQFKSSSRFELSMTELLKSGLRLGLRLGKGQRRFHCGVEMDDVKQMQNGVVLKGKVGRKGNNPKRPLFEIYWA
jgi:hypothetical protein